MTSANLIQATLLFVMLVIASATSQPFSRPTRGASGRRHTGFEWNTRRVGSRKVATISIRKEEERDRRSVAVTDGEDSERALHTRPLLTHHSHHQPSHHHQQSEDGSSFIVPRDSRHSIRSAPSHHRHHHGEEILPDDPGLPDVGGGGERTEIWESGSEEDVIISSERALVMTDTIDTDVIRELISAVNRDPSVLRNVTEMIERRREKKEAKSQRSKKKKRSKKREKKRRRNRGRKRKSRVRERKKKCKLLKGKEKKQCRAEAKKQSREVTTTMPPLSKLSGSDACQYQYLVECSSKVGFLNRSGDSQKTVVKCHYREQFFDCMEELRSETCDPSFETYGDVKHLRKQIRDAFHSTDSCLISEVTKG